MKKNIKGINMWIIRLVLFSSLVLILQTGCVGSFGGTEKEPISENNTVTETEPTVEKIKVGIGVERGVITSYPSEIQGLYYYGQVLISPQLTSESLKGPEAQTFLDHVSSLLGSQKKNFGLSAKPIIDGQVQPDIVLFNYSYDSDTKSWVTYLNEESRTRMVLLKSTTTLSFELKYTSVDGKTFNKIKELSKKINSVPVLISGTSIPYLDVLADSISNLLSSSISSTTVLSFNPVGNEKKSVEYIIKSGEHKELAKVNFSLILRDSVVSGKVVSSKLNDIPTVSSFTNPLNFVYTNFDSKFTLNDQLKKDESIQTISQIDNPTQFRTKCQNIINRLETYGLNIFDRYNSLFQILENTDYLKQEKLFNSGCLPASKLRLLKYMGITLSAPSSPRQNITISDINLENFGRYMLNPIANIGYKSDLLKLFSETLIIQRNELMDLKTLSLEEDELHMTPNEFMEMIGKVGVARFGLFNSQRKEYASFFFRPLKKSIIYRIKLNRERSGGKIRTVLIEPWNDDEISLRKQRELRASADSAVLGYEKDIMRLSSKSTVLLD